MDEEWVSKWDKYFHWKTNKQTGLEKKGKKKKEIDMKLFIYCEWLLSAANFAASEVLSHSVG